MNNFGNFPFLEQYDFNQVREQYENLNSNDVNGVSLSTAINNATTQNTINQENGDASGMVIENDGSDSLCDKSGLAELGEVIEKSSLIRQENRDRVLCKKMLDQLTGRGELKDAAMKIVDEVSKMSKSSFIHLIGEAQEIVAAYIVSHDVEIEKIAAQLSVSVFVGQRLVRYYKIRFG